MSRVAGKEDPVEFDFKQEMCSDMGGVVQVGDASRVNSEIPLLLSLLYLPHGDVIAVTVKADVPSHWSIDLLEFESEADLWFCNQSCGT